MKRFVPGIWVVLSLLNLMLFPAHALQTPNHSQNATYDLVISLTFEENPISAIEGTSFLLKTSDGYCITAQYSDEYHGYNITGTSAEPNMSTQLCAGENPANPFSIKILNVPAGEYFLQNTNVPDGFVLASEPIKISIDEDLVFINGYEQPSQDGCVTIQYQIAKGFFLPLNCWAPSYTGLIVALLTGFGCLYLLITNVKASKNRKKNF